MSALLTIDDSPSVQTDALCDFLVRRNVPALFFCRGDRLDLNPEPVVRAIGAGFFMGNHAYSHTRFSTLSYEDGVAEILKTETLIDAAYKKAGVARPAKYFRFPHMDRGTGGWIIDFDAAGQHKDRLIRLFAEGLNIDLTPPSAALRDKKDRLQEFLRAQGFVPLPGADLTLPWYRDTELAQAVDAMFTFSTSDWMVTPRHAGKWRYKTLADLLNKIDEDDTLWQSAGHHIILAHDQDDLLPVVSALVDHILDKGMEFRAL